MKRLVFLLLAFSCLLYGCAAAPEAAPTAAETIPQTTAAPAVILPLPVAIDPARLENAAIPVSLEQGDAWVDDTGFMQMHVTVYAYDLYDAADIARLEVGSRILLRGEEIEVTELSRTEYGNVVLNGGLDVGGYELRSDDSAVYYETGYSDMKSWYPIGEATIPVSQDFQYRDSSDLDRGEPMIYYPGDFLIDGTGIDYHFTPQSTTLIIGDGMVIGMDRSYTP